MTDRRRDGLRGWGSRLNPLAIFRRSGRDREEAYQSRLSQELATYSNCLDVNDLPAIYHYWSHNYVRPMLEQAGASNPDQFFAHALLDAGRACERGRPEFVSIGAGNCDTEVRVAKLIKAGGLDDFVIHCLDINPAMLDRGQQLANSEDVGQHILPMIGDFNDWRPSRSYAGIMANQSLHHVTELERLFDTVARTLDERSVFVVSDMIGRNGHARWPEALEAVNRFWHELPSTYRFNRQLNRQEDVFGNWDCSVEGFEGIRAQDILPALIERFGFEVFIAFGNVVDVFVDRSFGHNFDATADWDRDFIDRVHAYDEGEFQAGRLTPTHLFAVMRAETVTAPLLSRGLRPENCVRRP